MTKQELIQKLKDCKNTGMAARDMKTGEVVMFRYDAMEAHMKADKLLLEFIDDPEVSTAFDALGKYYG